MESKISKFLMLCAVTIGMGLSVTSCKDTAEDEINELRNWAWGDGTLNQGLDSQVQDLKTQLANLQAQVNAINSCTCDMASVEARLTQLQTELANKADKDDVTALQTEINALRTYIANTYVAKTTYETAIQNLQDQINAINNCTCDPTIPGRLAAAEQAIIEAKADAQAALTAAQNAQTAAEAAKTLAQNAKDAADAANTLATAAKTLAEANETAIANLNTVVEGIKDRIATMGDSLKVAYDNAASAEARSKADSIRIDELTKRVSDFETETKAELEKLAEDVAAARQLAIDNLAIAKEYAKQEADKVREELGEAVDNLNTRIDDLTKAYKAVDRALQAQIDDLDERMGEVEDALDDINTRLAKIEDVLKHLVTGVIVQGTYNPAFGSLRLPTGLNTNVLIAFYGEATSDVYFPTQRTGNYVRPEEALTAKDMQMLGLSEDVLFDAGSTLIGEEGANAGKVYLTVNPANVDFSGLNATLVNSQDKESVIKLGAAKKSDDVLKFGWTRAANNGFYEIPAYVDADKIADVQKLDFQTDKLKWSFKELVNNGTNANFKAIASHMYDIVMNLGLDANAVKVYRKSDVNGDSAVYSGYDIAATAVKPLSFESYKDLHVYTVPGYERAMSLIDNVAKEVKDKIHVAFQTVNGSELAKDIQALEINKVVIKDLTPEQLAMFEVSIDTTIIIDGLKYHLDIDENYNVPINFHDNQSVTVPSQKVTVPSISITDGGSATMTVDVVNEFNVKVGTATVPLGNVKTTETTVTIGQQIIDVPIDVNTSVTVNVKMDKLLYFGDGGTDKKSVHLWVTRDLKDAANSLWATVKDQIGGVNVMLDDLNEVVSDANGLLDDMKKYEKQADQTVDGYVTRVKNLIENLNSRLAGLINKANSAFQPVMFYDVDNTTHFLRSAKNYPSVAENGRITLIPISWNLEIVAPICRKHVAVTNVFSSTGNAQDGNGECKSALIAANAQSNMNEVIDGTVRKIELSGLRSGLTYEIAYSALDFHGKISTKKYYVTVK